MYHGDGSFKTKEIATQESLIELLFIEKEYVDKYNNIAIAIDLAKKNNLRAGEYYKDLDKIKESLDNVRNKITVYFNEKLNIKTTIADQLFSIEEE